jgi:hypothetical protein
VDHTILDVSDLCNDSFYCLYLDVVVNCC